MAENVRVAVRVRPFNTREKERNAVLIIDMKGNTTEIKDPAAPKGEKPRTFTFDFSYWSHDGFKEEQDGYLSPSGSRYADQRKVFNDLGQSVLDNAWKGYNCSLFAYGQTGSGKSYSMTGYGNNKGIVPICCEELFKGIEEKKKTAQKGEEFQVQVSMLEIYNEQVRDLLTSKKAPKGGLKVRQHPSKGFYVESLITCPVNSYADIDNKYQEGARNRTVAATQMNATSSRAHTIVGIYFTQKTLNDAGENMTKSSILYLVDLAGSERAESTGATGDRLKEGSAINQSLSTLGNVIKALADKGSGQSGVMVPFRNSVLTKLLKNALDGNSKTIMIAALSPADINYEETLSTLRFADRAKAIKTTATVNESPTDRLIRELREENERLKKLMESGGIMPAMEGDGGTSDEEKEEMQRQMKELMERNQAEVAAMQASWEEKLQKEREQNEKALAEQKQKEEEKKVTPYFWNLNEDPSLSGMLIHFCKPGQSRIGTKNAKPPPEIQLSGLNIQMEHATVTNKDNKVSIKPTFQSAVIINGKEISKEELLHHNDRILFGSTNLFVFHHPVDYAQQLKQGKKVEAPTFEKAQEEISETALQKVGFSKVGQSGSKEDLVLQDDLVRTMPMVNQCNAMSECLNKKRFFEIALVSPQARGLKEGRTEVMVKMKNLENGNEWMWPYDKFLNRKYKMEEMYNDFINDEKDWDEPPEKDPFEESADSAVLIGSVQVFLQSLGYLIDTDEHLSITDFRGIEHGRMQVQALPCDAKWKPIEDDFVEDPYELVGKQLNFKMKIGKVGGIPSKYEKVYVSYKFYLDDTPAVSKEMSGVNMDFNFDKQFTFKPVTQQLVDYLMNDPLVIQVYGKQKTGGQKGGTALPTRELMAREKTMIHQTKQEDMKNRMAVEVATERKKFERAETKLRKIQELVNKAKKGNRTELAVKDVEDILEGSFRFKGVADAVTLAKRNEAMGKNTSSACNLQ
ncbi:kinesin-like protein KIF28P [Lingula anatina]|uniref:Kinesin-like protein 6 n=1 Tax=Lingula anatina TaxID=7574 RepID=A0A1S3JCG6_LINAN|nr:kinesin-like protein KIF28P [Lingula anatina]|eukprot:XP_013407574.1 kinesin-like protein KIF28P [Lingula anatina]